MKSTNAGPLSEYAQIEAKAYLATDEEVTWLTQTYANGIAAVAGTKVTYLRVLIAHVKHDVGRRLKNLKAQAAIEFLEETHKRLYAIVLKAVTTPEIADAEDLAKEERTRRSLARNSRSNFARSSMTAVRNWVKTGGSLAALDPMTITKSELRRELTPEAAAAGSAERAANRARRALLALAKIDKEAAAVLLNSILEEVGPQVAKPLTKSRVRRGELTLTPEA